MRTPRIQNMGGGMKTLFSYLQDLEQLRQAGVWACKAVDHNSPEGCSNPECFKFKYLLPVIDELSLHKGLHAEARLAKVAVMTAVERRKMAAEVLALMIDDSDNVLTPDEIQEVWREAVCQEWATANGNGTFTLTEAGQRIVAGKDNT